MELPPPALLQALLFASGEPLSKKRLASLIGVSPSVLQQATDMLSEQLKGSGLAIVETEQELELRTAPEAAEAVKKLREAELSRDLGKAGLETLAVIAYQGSATRGDIDWVRGVNSSQTLRSLLLRGLVEKSEDEKDRRRARYHITVDALAHLGVARKEDLPDYQELHGALKKEQASVTEDQV